LALEAQQVQVAMVVLEEIQYFQPLPLQAVVMAVVLILLAAAAVRVVAVEKQRLEVSAIRRPPHHHKETMVAQHLLHLMAAAVAVAVQARLVAPQQILVAVDWAAMEQHLP
jgi:cytochrome c biogenesis factor